MAKKEFTYRGKTLNELTKLSDKEFAKLIPAKERRTLTRGYTDIQKRFIKKLDMGKNNIKTQTRDVVITCLLYTSPSPRDRTRSRMPSSA